MVSSTPDLPEREEVNNILVGVVAREMAEERGFTISAVVMGENYAYIAAIETAGLHDIRFPDVELPDGRNISHRFGIKSIMMQEIPITMDLSYFALDYSPFYEGISSLVVATDRREREARRLGRIVEENDYSFRVQVSKGIIPVYMVRDRMEHDPTFLKYVQER